MSEKEEKKELNAGFEFTFKDDSPVVNGNIEAAYYSPNIVAESISFDVITSKTTYFPGFSGYVDRPDETITIPGIGEMFIPGYTGYVEIPASEETVTGNHSFTYNLGNYLPNKGIELSDIKEHSVSGNPQVGYQYLTSYINENKNNPELLAKSISNILEEFGELYDHDKAHIQIGNSQEEILDKILSVPEGEELDGFICMTIHEFMMKMLNDCGIDAVILCGGTDDTNHATLLYQLEDGKYIWNNYGKSIVVNASNIKDAMAEIYKNSSYLSSCGYYSIIDGKSSYQEFALEKEAAFGNKMDKRDYQHLTPFDNRPDADSSSVLGRIELSAAGNTVAGIDTSLGFENANRESQLTMNIEYRKSGETEIFTDSQSIGLDIGYSSLSHKNESKDTFFDVNLTTAYTTGNTRGITYNKNYTEEDENNAIALMENDIYEQLQDADTIEIKPPISQSVSIISNPAEQKQHFSTFIKAGGGVSSELTSTDNMSLSHAFQGSLLGGATFDLNSSSIWGDCRILAEEGLNLNSKAGEFTFDNTLSAGLGTDLKLTGGTQKGGLQPVVKFNAVSGVEYNNNENLQVGVSGRAYGVVTRPTKEAGVEGSVFAQYRPSASDVRIFGEAGASLERQKLTMGGFNEQTENNVKINTTLGVQLNPNLCVTAGYGRHIDHLNPTRNYSTFNIGCKMKF